jgi:FtsK/SpoIIIE family
VPPASRTADSVWTRFGRLLAESPPALWINESVLRNPALAKSRTATRQTWARVADVGYPLIVVGRGVRRGGSMTGAWWKDASREKKQLHAVVALACVVAVGLLKTGPVLLVAAFVGGAAWLGRDVSRKGADPESAARISRLQAVYNGLVPYLQCGDDPDRHFKPGGNYRDAFTAWEFDDAERLVRLRIDYSEYFRDGEADSRAKVERALEGKVGQDSEYLYSWDEEGNHLDVRVLPPLPSGIVAQRWPVADIEFVLGFTDPGSVSRQIPVLVPDPDADETTLTPHAAQARDAVPPGYQAVEMSPVIWRVNSPDAEAHLLVLGGPFAGKSTTVRSLIAQALSHGHEVAVADMDQSAEYGGLAGKPGVLRLAEDAAASLELLDWLGGEVERRAAAIAAQREAADRLAVAEFGGARAAQLSPRPDPDGAPGAASPSGLDGGGADGGVPGVTPPLWVFVDDLPELADAAARAGRPDPQDTLAALARAARFARLTLVVTARGDRADALRPALRNQLTARIVLGKVDPALSTALFGGALELGGGQVMPPGRGYVRVGGGPVIRLQAPYAPSLSPSAV